MLQSVRTMRLLAVVFLAFSACGGSDEPNPTPAPTQAIALTPVPGPSQSVVDAQRDGVPASIAALPFAKRVEDRARIRTAEGIWMISRPSGGAKPDRTDYEEILLLDLDETKILRAYPLKSVPPRWITVGDDAVYCGRAGDGALPHSMVCRIDRTTFAPKVRIYTDQLDRWIPAEHPNSWEIEAFHLEMRDLVVDDVALWSEAREGWTRIDPASLTIVERGTPGPQGSPAPRVTAEPFD